VEAIFDQGPGQLFVVRVAGNVVGRSQLGSLEFAVEELGVPLILVLGHSHCGAVGAALSPPSSHQPWMESENIQGIVGRIARVLEGAGASPGAPEKVPPERAWRLNVEAAVGDINAFSEVIASRVQSGALRVVGSLFDLKTGRVEFFV
jgi:carbonic anhydrase